VDLDVIEWSSRIIYEANPYAISRTTDSTSIFFIPRTEDHKGEFIDLLFAELMLRGLALDGNLEELHRHLLSALVLEGKYRDNLQKLTQCLALEACIIALLHKTVDILHAENRIGIRLMAMVLIEGFSNALDRKINAIISSANETINSYLE
jgi:hypothetical protein